MEKYIIKAMLSREYFSEIAHKLEPSDFSVPYDKIYFAIVSHYNEYGSLLDSELINAYFHDHKNFGDIFDAWSEIEELVLPKDVKFYLDRFLEERCRVIYHDGLKNSVDCLTRPVKLDGYVYDGIAGSKKLILESIYRSELKGNSFIRRSSLREDAFLVWDYYEKSKRGDANVKFTSGFGFIDTLTSGCRPGQFWVVAGGAGEGKSTVMLNMGYYQYIAGHRVLALSLEMDHLSYSTKLFTRHAIEFDGDIQYQEVFNGVLSASKEETYLKAVEDFHGNPNYGEFILVGLGSGVTIDSIRSEIVRYKPDIVLLDYVQLMQNSRRRSSVREELSEIIRDLRLLSLEKNVFICSAYQINREGQKNAVRRGQYSLLELSETSEIERSAVVVISIYRKDKTIDGKRANFSNFKKSLWTSASKRRRCRGFVGAVLYR